MADNKSNRAAPILLYGDTGTGKSTLLSTYATWVWKKFKAKTRLYSFDLAGWSAEMQALVNVGIVEVWKVYTRDPLGDGHLISETLLRSTQGWWPEEIDPETGICTYASRLIPPQEGWRGAALYDGITSMSAWSMIEMGKRAAEGTLGGEAAAMKPVVSGELKLGSGNRASVGFTQGKSREWAMCSSAIKGLVARPVFTALEAKGMDSDTKLQMYGPQLAGQAKTAESPAWFGPSLGTLGPIDTQDGKKEWRLYLTDYKHPVTDPAPHKCNSRAPAAVRNSLPEYLADPPGDGSLTKFNLGYFCDLLEAAEQKATKALMEEFVDAPGIGKSTIGTGAAAKVAAPTAGPAAARGPLGRGPVAVRPAGGGVSAAPVVGASATTEVKNPEEAAGEAAPEPAVAAAPAAVVPGPARLPPSGMRPPARAPIPAGPARRAPQEEKS